MGPLVSMIQVEYIDDLQHPDLAAFRTMRRQEEHRRQGIFVAEGEKVVRRLVESPLRVLSVLLPPRWLPDYQRLLEQRGDDVRVYVAEKERLESLTGFSMYQGLLALARVPDPVGIDQILEGAHRPRLLVAVEGLSSAENLGTLVRNAAALGVQGLVVGETCASPYLRRAVRTSMGAVFRLPILETRSLVRTLEGLRDCGIRCVAAHPPADQRTLVEADLGGDCCLVFGSEGYGLTPGVLEVCDEAVSLPMQRGVDSLNVASAAAVFLYEASRQRTARR